MKLYGHSIDQAQSAFIAYAPGGNEKTGQHEFGEGLLAEVDLFGKGRTVLGFNALHGTAYTTRAGPRIQG